MNEAALGAGSPVSIYPGATIAERFRLERLLGQGSMGSVWRARHLALDVDVAVKFIDPSLRNEVSHRSRFTLEAQAAARINSPHVVSVLDFGTEPSGRLYIAMEYLDGEDLGRYLERAGQLSIDVTARIVEHACRGLAKAHAAGIVHRDIKPENLFLAGDHEEDSFLVKILDFGVAKAGQEFQKQFQATSAGQLIGSPAYMSPEQAHGVPTVDFRTDLFSLGVVAYHCLTGRLPFEGEGLADLLLSIVGREPAEVTRWMPTLPPRLNDWFRKALAKKPGDRFASAKEMAAAFAAVAGSVSFPATEQTGARLSAPQEPIGRRTISTPAPPRPQLSSSFTSSNRTGAPALSQLLGQLAEVQHVIGAGLVDAQHTCLGHHSLLGVDQTVFEEVARHAQSVLDAFDSIESSATAQQIGVHFENAIVLLRYVEQHALVVVATEQLHPTLLSVTLNAVTTKLQALAQQAGGLAAVFRSATSLPNPLGAMDSVSGVVSRAAASDVVEEGVLQQFSRLLAKSLGPMARLAIQQQVGKSGKPTIASYPEFAQRLISLLDQDADTRARLLAEALKLVPAVASQAPATRSSTDSRSGESSVPSAAATIVAPPITAPVTAPTSTPSMAAPVPPPAPSSPLASRPVPHPPVPPAPRSPAAAAKAPPATPAGATPQQPAAPARPGAAPPAAPAGTRMYRGQIVKK